ncbi:MAG: rhodanese-like domain-containing protein [Minicystis sp.]
MVPGLDRPLLLRTLALFVGGALLGLAVNAGRAAPLALRGFEVPVVCSAGEEGPAAPLEQMSAAAASTMCAREGVVFADTRSAGEFAEGHIADAVHLPCDASASGADTAIKHLGPARTIIVYGTSTDDGHKVAETLRARGLHGDLRVLEGGFAAWEKQGLACASGPCHECTVAGSTKEPGR